MIAAIHPGYDYVRMRPSPIRTFASPLTAAPTQKPPVPKPEQPQPGQHPVEIVTAQEPVVEPASASIATPPAETIAPFSLSDWLTEETLWPGYPNGAVAAGAVVALAWIFGRKGKRR